MACLYYDNGRCVRDWTDFLIDDLYFDDSNCENCEYYEEEFDDLVEDIE